MRLLLVTNRFSPDYGGIETVSLSLAEGLGKMGFTVEVLTHTSRPSIVDTQLKVTRHPSLWGVFRAYKNADVILHNNICLRFLWPVLLLRRPVVFAVHNWLRAENGKVGVREMIKRKIIGSHRSITVSRAVQASLPFNSTLVYNSCNFEVFYSRQDQPRVSNSIAFVGRLIPGKGCLVLVEALGILSRQGIQFKCSIIGDGTDRSRIEERIKTLGLSGVEVLGSLDAQAIADVLCRTEVLAVPSHYGEAFGIVALEGVASGCYVVTSDDGGLPEAVGRCGESVPQEDAAALADAIRKAWARKPWADPTFTERRADHLARFSEASMLSGYRQVLEDVMAR